MIMSCNSIDDVNHGGIGVRFLLREGRNFCHVGMASHVLPNGWYLPESPGLHSVASRQRTTR